MTYNTILVAKDNGLATITLNAPDKLNAVSRKMIAELKQCWEELAADASVRAVLLTGAGRGFCAGADLSSGGNTFAKGGSDVQTKVGVPRDGGGLVSLRIFESTKPVIGAIAGPAVAGGFEIALWCDLRVMESSAYFGVYCRRWGVPLIDGGTVRLSVGLEDLADLEADILRALDAA